MSYLVFTIVISQHQHLLWVFIFLTAVDQGLIQIQDKSFGLLLYEMLLQNHNQVLT